MKRIVEMEPAKEISNYDPFLDMVAEDVSGRLEADKAADLRRPENIDRFINGLVELINKVDRQNVQRKADLEQLHVECGRRWQIGGQNEYFNERAKYAQWWASANAFKTRVIARLRDVKTQRQNARDEVRGAGAWRMVERAAVLLNGVDSEAARAWLAELNEIRKP